MKGVLKQGTKCQYCAPYFPQKRQYTPIIFNLVVGVSLLNLKKKLVIFHGVLTYRDLGDISPYFHKNPCKVGGRGTKDSIRIEYATVIICRDVSYT